MVAGLLLLLLLLAFVSWQRYDQLRAQQARSVLMARVLEDHTTRSIETASLALSALAEVLGAKRVEADAAMGWLLNQTLAGMPALRSLAVINSQGRVLTSTEAEAVGTLIDLQRLGPPPAAGSDTLGAYVRGRGLASLALQPSQAQAPAGVGFVPLMRRLQTQEGTPLLLVGLINPDAIANHQEQVLKDEMASAMLLSLDGQVLAATTTAGLQPGQRAAGLPVLARYLPDAEHGSYVGEGTRPGPQVLAFRVSRTRSVLVVVETAQSEALADWRRETAITISVTALALAGLALMTALTSRSLQAREAARQQRDAAQAEVARREGELSAIASSVQELLFRTDRDSRLVFVNARWHNAGVLGDQPLLGRTLADLVRPDSAAAACSLFADEGPKGQRTELVQLGLPGQERDFQVAVAPLNSGSEITGFAGSAVDVTEQRRAQSQLHSQLAFNELLLEVLPLPLSILDDQGRYVSVNKAWIDFTGRARQDVIGRPARQFQSEADAQLHDKHDRLLLTEGGRTQYAGGTQRRDGTRRELSVTKAAVPGPDGQPAGILAVFMDVTEFREAERATREARDAAEDASRSKSEFIANISHELRTPLQSILGFSELGHARSADQHRLNLMFGDIHAAGQRMLALVNDLLDVAKMESVMGSIQPQAMDVRPLAHEVVAELAPQLGQRRLQMEVRLGPEPLLAPVDPARFQQVLRNVLANAVRFSPPGVPLVLEGHAESDTRIRLSVVDRGPGIPPAEIEKIFEAFVQSSKTKDGAGGTGLGLAISRKIMQAHGGEIRAENNAFGGATFHIYLPARP